MDKKKAKKRAPRKNKPKPNVPADIFAVWKKLKRYGDTERMVKRFAPVTQPTVSKALLYGYAKPELAEKINAYYMERMEGALNDIEKSVVEKYNQLMEAQNNLKK